MEYWNTLQAVPTVRLELIEAKTKAIHGAWRAVADCSYKMTRPRKGYVDFMMCSDTSSSVPSFSNL